MNKKIALTLSLIILSIPIQAMRVPCAATKYRYALSTPKLEKVFRQDKELRVQKDVFTHLAVQVSANRMHGIERPWGGLAALGALQSDIKWQMSVSGNIDQRQMLISKKIAFYAFLQRLTDNWDGSEKENDEVLQYSLLVNDREMELTVDNGHFYREHLAWIKRSGSKELPPKPYIYVSSIDDDFCKDHEHHKKICNEFVELCHELEWSPK